MATQTMAIAPGNDIQLRGLGKNGVASMAVKKMMASRREKGTMQAHMKKIPRLLKLAQVRQVKILKSIPLA